jgi:hypothetical protein
MIGLHGKHINLFIEPGPSLGPVLEVTVNNVGDAKQRLVKEGCGVVKDDPDTSQARTGASVPIEMASRCSATIGRCHLDESTAFR